MGFLSLGKMKSAALQSIAGSTLPIAIDFGVGSLKLLQMSAGAQDMPPQLIAAAAIETPEQLLHDHALRFQFQFQALPRMLKGVNFKGKRAVCAIPAGVTFVKHMQFPRNDNVDLADLVQTGVPAALNCAPDALILRHFTVDGAQTPGSGGSGSSGAKQEVICMAAARDFVGKLMGAIKDCRLECVGIHPECIATVKAFEHINRRVADGHVGTLYLDLAAGSTKVWIAHGSTLVFAKTIQVGGRDLDAAVAHALDVDTATARAKRLAASVLVAPAARPAGVPALAADPIVAPLVAGMGPDGVQSDAGASSTATADERRESKLAPGLTPPLAEQAPADLAPPEFDLADYLETLTDEVAMCLRYYEAMFPGKRVDRAILFGGEARHRGLCQHIARKIRLPAHVADPLARMGRTGKESVRGVDFTTPQPGWTIPFGLSLCPTQL